MDSPSPPNRGETDAFREVYEQELGYVVHSLRRLGVRPSELEDVAHDTFVAVYRHFAERDPSRPIKPWLFGFCYRIASDHRKLARHRHEAPPPAVEPRAEGPLPDEEVEDARLRRLVLATLDAMDFDKKSLVVMHDLEGLPVPEIAGLLALPLNTTYSRLRLARAEFEKIFRQKREEGGAARG